MKEPEEKEDKTSKFRKVGAPRSGRHRRRRGIRPMYSDGKDGMREKV
jgi:hypothetical protein